jgi:hypothetical protein
VNFSTPIGSALGEILLHQLTTHKFSYWQGWKKTAIQAILDLLTASRSTTLPQLNLEYRIPR